MAEIDTSSYGQANKIPTMMDNAQGFLGMMQQANQNKLFQGTKAAGQELQKSIGPDGQVDPNAYAQGIKSNPLVAPVAAEAVQTGQAIQSNKIGIDKAKFDLITNQMGFMRSTLSSLAVDPQLNSKKIIEATGKLIANGVLTPQQAAIELASLPQDPDGMKAWVTQHLTNTMSAAEKFNAAFGTPQLVPGVGPNGEAIQTPVAIPSAPGMPVRPIGGQPAPQGEGQAPAASPMQNGAFTTSLAPGEQSNMEASAKAYQDLRGDLNTSAQRVFTLNKALTSLKGADTGPNSDWRNNVLSFAQGLAGEGVIPGIDPEKIKNYDEANKYLIQYASQQAAGMGPGTDTGLATALSGNANTSISNLAAQDVVKANMALERMKQAQAAVFEKSGQPAQKFSGFSTNWNKNIDPVAFSVDLLDGKARKKYFSGLSKEKKQRFLESLKIGIQTGVIDKSALGG